MTQDEIIKALEKSVKEHKNNRKVAGAKNIYVASPWFNDVQGKAIIKMVDALLQNPTIAHAHIPLLNQFEGNAYTPEGDFKPDYVWATQTYKADVKAIDNSDIVVAAQTPYSTDPGTDFEIGYAVASHKPVVAFFNGDINDKEHPVNLMISFGIDSYVLDVEELKIFDFLDIETCEFKGQII